MLPFVLVAAVAVVQVSSEPVHIRASQGSAVCQEIVSAISNASEVFFPPSLDYVGDLEHYATSSMDNSTCSVEPGTAEDVGKILEIVGQSQIPFAVKGGGHIMNPGYSSTTGVHISMTRFNDIIFDSNTKTAQVGMGLLWDEVYASLQQHSVTVVGGRVSGIGIAGFSLGGGYSWLTNQHGLTIDTIQEYELVLPNGTVTIVTSEDSDLFFALKGSHNNFGIVTKITLQTYPQGQVWGGSITYLPDQTSAVMSATANFSANNTDPKAQLLAELNFLNNGTSIVSAQLFYDGPEPPAGIFDEYLAIPSVLSTIQTRSFLSFVQDTPSNATAGLRGRYNSVSLAQLTPSVIDAIVSDYNNRTAALSKVPQLFSLISYDLEPFLNTIYTFNTSATAYPPDRSRALLPFNLAFAWTTSDGDDAFVQAIEDAAAAITAAADAEGQNVGDAALYPNYAISGTPLERIYGANLPRLQSIKQQYDPENVMGLAGGWKL